LGVVTMRYGRAKDGHHRVADELFEIAAERLDGLLGGRVIALQQVTNVLGVAVVSTTREADEIDKEHRYELALLLGLGRQRRTAGEAEASLFRVLFAAASAAHWASLAPPG